MKVVYTDGGRSKYFKADNTGDCVCRAIALATDRDYKEIYDFINKLIKEDKKDKSSSRNGVSKQMTAKIFKELGWTWVPTMKFGEGCRVHLREDELPSGTIVVNLSKHVACVKDGVLYDTHDCSRNGTRCVYGYWIKK